MSINGLEPQIAEWRLAMSRQGAVDSSDLDELEGHLREQVADLEAVGLSADEAFLIGVKRLGQTDQVTAEFAQAHGDRLWKQLMLESDPKRARRPFVSMLVFAGIAAVGIQIARLASGGEAAWFSRDLGLFVLPVLAAYFVWLRRERPKRIVVLAAVTVVLAAAASFFPFHSTAQTSALVAIHLPIAL